MRASTACGGPLDSAYLRIRGLQASQEIQCIGILAFSLLRGQSGQIEVTQGFGFHFEVNLGINVRRVQRAVSEPGTDGVNGDV